MKYLFFDIETEANKHALEFMPEPNAPANYKDPEKIKAYIEDKKAEQSKTAALDPDYGEIIAISYQYGVGGELATLLASELEGGEAELISLFWRAYADANGRSCGYNIMGFDLPYLMRRSFSLRIMPSVKPFLAKYRTDPTLDLMAVLYNWGQAKGLKWVCKRYGIQNDLPDLDGSQVGEMDAETLKAYCANDVKLVVRLFQRMQGIYF